MAREIKVGRWDCEACGHIGVLGPETKCTKCGAPRPKNVKFYLSSDAEVVKDEKQIKEALAGADWVCNFCLAHNKTDATHCNSCNNIRDEADAKLLTKIYNSENEARRDLDVKPKTNKSSLKNKPKFTPLLLLPIVFAVLLIGNLFRGGKYNTSQIDLYADKFDSTKLISFYYISNVFISYDTVHLREGWELPAAAFEVKKSEKIKNYESRKVGERTRIESSSGTSYPSYREGLKITRTENKRVSKGYETVDDGYETYIDYERVKVGTESYECGTKDLGNGYFETKYCDRPIYERRSVRKERKKTKRVEKFEDVTYYYWTYPVIEAVMEKFPVYATYYNYKLNVRDKRKLEYRSEENIKEIVFSEYEFRKGKNEKLESQAIDYFFNLSSVNYNFKDIPVPDYTWKNAKIGDAFVIVLTYDAQFKKILL
jgi:hypothetical protein